GWPAIRTCVRSCSRCARPTPSGGGARATACATGCGCGPRRGPTSASAVTRTGPWCATPASRRARPGRRGERCAGARACARPSRTAAWPSPTWPPPTSPPPCSCSCPGPCAPTRRWRPACLVLYAESSGWGRAALAACRAAGVPAVALQHGIVYPKYYSYRHGPGEEDCPRPDKTAVFGQAALRLLVEMGGYDPASLVVTGSPKFDDLLASA